MGKRTILKTPLAISIFLVALATGATAAGRIIYVDDDAAGANDGSSWSDGYNYLQDALADANSADKPVEIRVAQGIYRPNQGILAIPDFDWRTATFQLINGVSLKGGFAGFGEPDPNTHNVDLYETVLSGDLNGDDVEVSDPCDLLNEPTRSENSYHVVTGSGTDETAVMDGFVITGGVANGKPLTLQNEGGGMLNDFSSPALANCKFQKNCASTGGGMFNEFGGPILVKCAFNGNYSDNHGGGIFNYRSNLLLRNCTFTGNFSRVFGGGISCWTSSPGLTGCIFSGNIALLGAGGGMYNEDSNATLSNCTFVGNWAGSRGGAIYLEWSFPTLVNCILWRNIPGDASWESLITYSDVPRERVWGEGNISTNPLFADPGYWDPNGTPDDPNDDFWVDGDYHLKSEAGRWDPDSESWVQDDITSPCIDAGDPNSDWAGELWPHGERVNMGAYGGTAEASMSPYDANSIPDLAQASNPSPADETAVGIHIKLSWTAGLYAVSHDVYFGTSSSPPFVCNQTETEFDPGTLSPGTTYFWRIEEVDSKGNKTTGKVWRFTTIPPKGRACFTAETGVWLDGALIPISKVSVGRNVGCTDGAGGANSLLWLPSLGKVEESQEHDGTFACYDVLLETGNCISVAECHYFLAEDGRWVALQNLKAGTRLQSPKGSIGIISVTKRPIPYVGKVYNLKVEGSDRYLVGEDAVIVRDY